MVNFQKLINKKQKKKKNLDRKQLLEVLLKRILVESKKPEKIEKAEEN